MRVAIYSRKSKMTEAGDSIQNQINICKEYAIRHFGECEFKVYEDEGFSGGNVKRPMFKRMISDADKKGFDILICYRLDRLSRSVNDFSNTYEILEKNSINFVSVTEQFDTSNPLGKAMLSIASVFAQLERDTTAQRITDNFTELAKTGRYLTSTPPHGFAKERLFDSGGKSYNILKPILEEMEVVKLLYNKYLEWGSITKVEMYCFENRITNRLGNTLRTAWISNILRHEIYATADKYTYEYFKSLEMQVVSEKDKFDGKHGVMVYRKTRARNSKHSKRGEVKDFIISVGLHEGVIPSQDWIEVQNKMNARAHLGVRKATGNHGLLNGLLRCSFCGSFMRSCCVRGDKFHYVCVTKEKSRMSLCKMKNVQGSLDNEVANKIKDLLSMPINVLSNIDAFSRELSEITKQNDKELADIGKRIKEYEKSISNLVMKLSKTNSSVLLSKIEQQVEQFDAEIIALKQRKYSLAAEKEVSEQKQLDMASIRNTIERLKGTNFALSTDTVAKRNTLKTFVKQINWDGKDATIIFL